MRPQEVVDRGKMNTNIIQENLIGRNMKNMIDMKLIEKNIWHFMLDLEKKDCNKKLNVREISEAVKARRKSKRDKTQEKRPLKAIANVM